MAHFMRDDISLREIAGRVETLAQFFIERKIDVNLLVAGTVEWTNRRTHVAARSRNLIGEEYERWFAILPPVLTKDLAPNEEQRDDDHQQRTESTANRDLSSG
jgi:hypothetical protein